MSRLAIVSDPPLRVWPGVLATVLLLFTRLVLPVLWPNLTIYGVLGGFAGAALILAWWLLLSRAPWIERLGAVVLRVAGIVVTWRFVDISISTGAMGGLLPLLAVPPLAVLFVAWAVLTRRLSTTTRRATMAATIFAACGMWTLVKTGGFDANFDNDLMWRWAQTKEDRLMADASAALPAPPPALSRLESTPPATSENAASLGSAPSTAATADSETATPAPAHVSQTSQAVWPGFRGPLRDGIVHGVHIDADWTKRPPVELWRRPIGPGWASFAVQGDLLYTQEQRGDDEVVACYSVTTGQPVWRHSDATRFWESNAGPGPRATPTLSNGRVYTCGATGIVNALDAADGAVVWSRNAASDTKVKVPGWGFASSPLVVDGVLIVATA